MNRYAATRAAAVVGAAGTGFLMAYAPQLDTLFGFVLVALIVVAANFEEQLTCRVE